LCDGVLQIFYVFGNFGKSSCKSSCGNRIYVILIRAFHSISANNLKKILFGAVFEKIYFYSFFKYTFSTPNFAKMTTILKKFVTVIKELIIGNNLCLKKNCLSAKI